MNEIVERVLSYMRSLSWQEAIEFETMLEEEMAALLMGKAMVEREIDDAEGT